jgi:membrane-associated phospholipid phosphatase
MDVIGALMPFDLDSLSGARWPLIGLGTVAFLVLHWTRSSNKTTVLQVLGEILILVPAYFAYFLVRGFVEGKEAAAFHRAVDIIELEQALGIFWEPNLQEHIMRFGWGVNIANWTYIWGHWPVIVFAALWLFLMHRESYSIYRNAFIISGAIGLIIFTTFPTAPPRFMDAWGFVDTVTNRSEAYRVLQPPAFVNQYAAMPSLHFGWNLLVGIAIFRNSTGYIGKAIGVVLPVVMFGSIVLTANHYIIDGIAGGSLAMLGLFAAIWLNRLFQRDNDPPASRVPETRGWGGTRSASA